MLLRVLADIADPDPADRVFELTYRFVSIGVIVGLVILVAVAAFLIIRKIKKGK